LVENCANNGDAATAAKVAIAIRAANPNITASDAVAAALAAGAGWTPAKPQDVVGAKCDGFHMYRVSRDIAPQFHSTMYNLQQLRPFLGGQDANGQPLSRPHCWAYADMLMVGRLPHVEGRTHFGAWCVTSSPLVLGFDLTDSPLLESVRSVISNQLAISVQQAWHGSPGELLLESEESFDATVWHDVDANGNCEPNESNYTKCEQYTFPVWQVWAKPLNATALALLVVNLGEAPLAGGSVAGERFDSGLARLGWGGSQLATVSDVWAQRIVCRDCDVGACDALALRAEIPPHDSVFLVLQAAAESGWTSGARSR